MLINSHIVPILKEVKRNPIVVVNAPTGSGKSLGIPMALGAINTRTFVSVPTRTAATSLYNTQKIMSSGNFEVGYAAEGDIMYNDKSLIVYVTSGHLRKKLLSYFRSGNPRDIDFCNVLIIDEIHTGSIDDSVNLALWKIAANRGVRVPRLILATATLPKNIASINGLMYKISQEGGHPVDLMYHPRSYQVYDIGIEFYNDLVSVIVDLTKRSSGNMLIFLPGSNEIEQLRDLLLGSKSFKEINKNVTVLTAYGAMKTEDLQRIYEPVKPGDVKVIIATNVAETSITITDISVVIDTLLEKRAETSQSGGHRLVLRHVSKDSAIQRCGRTGRTGSGICYRMCTKEFYENLDQSREDELLRLPIDSIVLEMYSIGLDPYTVFPEIPKDRMDKTIEQLKSLKCLEGNNVTGIGSFVVQFPLSIRNATVLYKWNSLGLPMFPCIAAMSLIDSFGPSYFWTPRKETEETNVDYMQRIDQYRRDHFDKFKGASDPETLLKMWNDFVDTVGGYPASDQSIKQWTSRNSINNKKFREALTVIKQVMKSCKRLNINVEIGPFTVQGVMDRMIPVLEEVYSDRILSVTPNESYTDISGARFRLDDRSLNTIDPKVDNTLLCLLSIELSNASGKTGLNIINLAVPIKKEIPLPNATKRTTRRPSKQKVSIAELEELLA